MSNQTKTTATGNKGKTNDVITQLKKETEGVKDTKAHEKEDIDWDGHISEEEEEPTQKKGIVIEQGKVGTNKPRKLGDLFASEAPKQTKTGIKKPYDAKDKRPQTATTGAKEYQGDVKKPTFSNSKGTQNKDTPLTGATVKATEKPQFSNTKGVQNKESNYTSSASTIKTAEKPLFSNSTGVKNKENSTYTAPATEKIEAPKRFVGSFNKAAEENSKVKAPAKDYLEGDNKTKYKGEESTIKIEKPKFLSKNVEGAEPHFKDITKNEDKLTETPTDIQNVYSEPRIDKDRQDRPKKVYKDFKERDFKDRGENKDRDGKDREYKGKDFQDREHREHREPREPREYREKKQEKEDEVKYDSDGFEIVATVKTKPDDFKPKRKYYENNRNFDKNDKDRKPYQKKPYQKRDKSGEKNGENSEKVEETNEAVVEKTEEKEVPKIKKADKATVVIDKSKKLKDLF